MASIKALAAIALTLMVAAPIGFGYLFSMHDVEYTEWQEETSLNVSQVILNHSTDYYMPFTGTTNNSSLANGVFMDYVDVSTNPTAYPTYTITSHSISFTGGVAVDLSAYDYWTTTIPGYTAYSIDGGQTIAVADPTIVSGNGGTLMISNSATLTVVEYADDGTYANISAGWKLPTTSERWINNQTNESVTFVVELPDNATVWFGNLRLQNTSGTVTGLLQQGIPPGYPDSVSFTVGNYRYMQVVIGLNQVEVSGITGFPIMGTSPTLYNTNTIERANAYTLNYLDLQVNDLDTVFRVDGASVLAGTFPSTYDYTLDMDNLYPARSYTLKLNSIGVYGTTITIGSTLYTITNGRINVNGDIVPLKGATISSHYNGAIFENTINGKALADTATSAPIIFGGEWSLTITGSLDTQVNGTKTEWNPGEFAFDKQDFAAVGLMVAGACLIGLGMMGQRSGAKMGILMLICGGAAFAYLTMI